MPRPVPLSLAQLEAVARVHGTPFQLYDEAGIRDNARALLAAFTDAFPGFKQYFAVKALPSPAVVATLVAAGCGLDCSSAAELHLAHLLGVPGDRVMYTSNYTSRSDLRVALAQGVVINLDDASLVDTVKELNGGRTPPLLCFRLNPGVGRTDSETASNVLGGPTAKFGVPPDAIVAAYRAAAASGTTRFGMHMMTGSCVISADYWRETVTILLDTVARVHRELGVTFEFINIGGGLGIPYQPTQAAVDVAKVVATLRDVVTTRLRELSLPFEPCLAMENGRYMTGPFGWLVTRCEVVKRAFGGKYLGVDACMANLMRPGMYGAYHHITIPAHGPGAEMADGAVKTHVVGTLCENNDWFARDRPLPLAAGCGDLVVIHDTGAHSHSMGFQYNGKLRAPELLLRSDGTMDVIRDRETVHCLLDNTHLPSDIAARLPPAAVAPWPYTGRPRPAAAAERSPTAAEELASGKVPVAIVAARPAPAAAWPLHTVAAVAIAVLVAAAGGAALGRAWSRRR